MTLQPKIKPIQKNQYVTYKYKGKTYVTTIKKNLSWKDYAQRKTGSSKYQNGDFLRGFWIDLTEGVVR